MKEQQQNQLYGLSEQEVAESRSRYGANILTPPRRRSLWRLYLEKYEDPIIRILLVAAAVSLALAFVSGEFVETIGIILAVLFATTVGFYFERDAARKFDVLTALGEEQPVKVRRNGQVHQVSRQDVVVGDIVLIETGDEVPADGTLLVATDLQIDESSLTGETLTKKQTSPVAADQEEGAYPRDMVLRSSMVMNGSGIFRVVSVGDHTEIGKVARESMELTHMKTPLNLQLSRLANLISKVGTGISVAAFLGFLIHDILTKSIWHTDNYIGMAEVVLHYFMMAVTLIVMAVPEGLPMAVTLALALNMRRMLRTNNLVRKLSASETMGAVTVICTDKTGTLTQNRMAVVEVSGELGDGSCICLNTTAELDGDKGIGNPTEVALLRYLQTLGIDYRTLREQGEVVERVPFSTERKMMQTTIEIGGECHIYIKGAPEIVLANCVMTPEERCHVEAQLQQWQQQAMRTLAFVCDGQFQAIVAISDPIRDDVAQAVKDCQKAGIELKIVTGDTEGTAMEIARQIGIFEDTAPKYAHITGAAFAALSDEEALECVKQLRVMSRARPADKQRLVELLQRVGQVVAVTGDGTNDAPALNHAHVGLSLGSGTSVAKNASDITIIDDSFRSVVRAVLWGRSLYRNIQRFIFFQLVVNVTALLLVFFGSIIGTELPLTVTQILWINLIMDTFAAMALASLPPSREVMNEKPRAVTDAIVTRGMLRGILGLGITFFLGTFVYLYWLENNAVGEGVNNYELTKFFTAFVMLQWWNLFNAKTLGSHYSAFRHLLWARGFVFVLILILFGQFLIVEWGGEMFRTVPITAIDWLQIILLTSPVLIIGEIYRFVNKKR